MRSQFFIIAVISFESFSILSSNRFLPYKILFFIPSSFLLRITFSAFNYLLNNYKTNRKRSRDSGGSGWEEFLMIKALWKFSYPDCPGVPDTWQPLDLGQAVANHVPQGKQGGRQEISPKEGTFTNCLSPECGEKPGGTRLYHSTPLLPCTWRWGLCPTQLSIQPI